VPDAPSDGGQRVSLVSEISSPFRVDRIDLLFDGAPLGTPASGPWAIDLRPLRDGTHVVAARVVLSLPCTLGEEPRERITLRLVRYVDTRGAFEARFALETLGAPLAAFEQRPTLALAVAGGATVQRVRMVQAESLPIPAPCESLGGSARLVCAAKEELDAAEKNGDRVAADCAAQRLDEMHDALGHESSDAAIAHLASRACIAHDPVQPGDTREVAACPLPEL
jgi:hypothetical protein